jgi:hypothetical protein
MSTQTDQVLCTSITKERHKTKRKFPHPPSVVLHQPVQRRSLPIIDEVPSVLHEHLEGVALLCVCLHTNGYNRESGRALKGSPFLGLLAHKWIPQGIGTSIEGVALPRICLHTNGYHRDLGEH